MAIVASPELIRAIRKYKAGEQATFDEIYHGSIQYITKCVLNVLNRTAAGASEDLQQDIIQETYLTIATKLDTLQSEEAFLQWAGQIATNHALRTWQKDVHQHEQELPEDEQLYELPDERFIPEDILENKEKQQLIRKMLQELPTNQYLCLVEYFYNGLKETEIAQKLDMPLGTVKTNLSRAKKKMKDIVQTHEKKSGVKLYSMSWLLLLLFWQDIKALFINPAASEKTLDSIRCALEAGTAGAVALSATGTAATGTAAGAATAGSTAAAASATVGATLATKIIAAVLAIAVTIGGIAGGILKNNQRQKYGKVIDGVLYYEGHRYEILEFDGVLDSDQPFGYCEARGGMWFRVDSWEEWLAVFQFVINQGYDREYFRCWGIEGTMDDQPPAEYYILKNQKMPEPWHTDVYVICEWAPGKPIIAPGDEATMQTEIAEPTEVTEITEATETTEAIEPTEATEPTLPPVELTDEQRQRMERILLYTAFLDSGANEGLVLASYGGLLSDVELEKYPFLQQTEPLPEWWDKNDLLLLLGWNREPVLDVWSLEGNQYCGALNACCYSLSTAQELMTGIFGAFDSSYLDGNVFIRGYYTEVSEGKVYQPAEHLYSQNYGTLTVDGIEALEDGTVRIYATYTRDATLRCVYEAVLNENSYIGVNLTGVSYTFAE